MISNRNKTKQEELNFDLLNNLINMLDSDDLMDVEIAMDIINNDGGLGEKEFVFVVNRLCVGDNWKIDDKEKFKNFISKFNHYGLKYYEIPYKGFYEFTVYRIPSSKPKNIK
jgi:hypothetical protein